MNPKIDIVYSKLLTPVFNQWVLLKYPNTKIPTSDEVIAKTKNYRRLWEKHGELILKGITEATGMAFKRAYIPVYVVAVNPRPFSNPLVIKSRYTDDEFIRVIAHELIHNLFADNKETYKEPYPDNVHKIVHAVLASVFLDVLKDEKLLAGDVKDMNDPVFATTNREYAEAWKFVEEIGYKAILDDFKKNTIVK